MRMNSVGVTAAFCALAVTVCVAADPQIGSWKLNESKSKLTGSAKNTLVVYSEAGDSMKVAIDGVDSAGKTFHSEWTGKIDGKDYAVTGDSASDMRAYTRVNPNHLNFVSKSGGKVTLQGTVIVSADGKSRTVKATGVDASGKKQKPIVAVYDKQ
jgi:hypothetical protein